MSLSILPNELIGMITSYLRLPELDRLAQTFNQRLYDICLPRLIKITAFRRDAKLMTGRFGGIGRSLLFGIIDAEDSKKFGLDNGAYRYYLDVGIGSNAYMFDPDGDFSWFDSELSSDYNEEWRHTMQLRKLELERLVEKAGKSGVVLPPSFVRFMLDEKLLYFIPPGLTVDHLPEHTVLSG